MQVSVRKITKQIFKGQLTHMSIFTSFLSHFLLKLQFLCLFFLLFPLLNFDFTIYFYILVLYSLFGQHKLGSSFIERFGKTAFTAEFFTVANNLYFDEK